MSESNIPTETSLTKINSDIPNSDDPKLDAPKLDKPDLNETDQKFLTLKADLKAASETTQLKAIIQFEDFGIAAISPLLDYLSDRLAQRTKTNLQPTFLDGRAYQIIVQKSLTLDYETQLKTKLDQGILPLSQALKLELATLQNLLVQQQFEDADRLTSKIMRQLASKDAADRGWIYFSEVAAIATLDLQTIDQLWTIYSEGKFGFAIQRRIWLSLGKKWEDFWLQIDWKKGGSFTRYPGGFTWSLKAPKGHLPLSNQIRGNKTLEAIFNHVAWQ